MVDDETEEWRPVVGYEGMYEVSSFGNVRRVAYLLTPTDSGEGYLRVRLFQRRGDGKRHSVHALVAAAFIGPRPTPLHEVNHKDGKHGNNREGNLEYLTKLENMRHSFEVLGRPYPPKGEQHNSRAKPETVPRGIKHGNAKLNDAKVTEIRARYAAGGVSQPMLAREYGVTQRVIWSIVNWKTWRHVS